MDLNLRFAIKSSKSDKYKHWFVDNKQTETSLKTRSEKSQLVSVKTRTVAFFKSPLAYLTRLINENEK